MPIGSPEDARSRFRIFMTIWSFYSFWECWFQSCPPGSANARSTKSFLSVMKKAWFNRAIDEPLKKRWQKFREWLTGYWLNCRNSDSHGWDTHCRWWEYGPAKQYDWVSWNIFGRATWFQISRRIYSSRIGEWPSFCPFIHCSVAAVFTTRLVLRPTSRQKADVRKS